MTTNSFQYKNNSINIFAGYDLFIEHSSREWIKLCNNRIRKKGLFCVALSGGSTPQAIYKKLVQKKHLILDTSKIVLFWSDERCVALTDSQSNYYNAMSVLSELDIPKDNIFHMPAEHASASEATNYENTIKSIVSDCSFDLIMLGIGEDGHTASLFPNTQALREDEKLVIINNVPQKNICRMTLTYPCLKKAHNIYIYVAGLSKAPIIKEIFTNKQTNYPISFILSHFNKNSWFIDNEAGREIIKTIK